MIWTTISLFGALWWCVGLTLLIGSAAAAFAAPFRWKRNNERLQSPPVSAIIPVKDLTPNLAAAFESLFAQDYPAFEVLVSVVEELAALDEARSIAAHHPNVPARFIVHDPRAASNPKVNNLFLPITEAHFDLILIKDSGIRLDKDALTEMINAFAGETGLVVAVPIATTPENFAAEIECAAMNGYVARFLLAASALGMGFGIGATMLFSRRDFKRAGGIAQIANSIGEDHAISRMLAGIGRKTIITGTAEQSLGRRGFAEIWQRQLRWAVCRRHQAPTIFHAELCASAFVTALAGAIAAASFGVPASVVFIGTIAAWTAVDLLLTRAKSWPLSWRSPLASLSFTLGFPLLWLQAKFARRISWSGSALTVARAGTALRSDREIAA